MSFVAAFQAQQRTDRLSEAASVLNLLPFVIRRGQHRAPEWLALAGRSQDILNASRVDGRTMSEILNREMIITIHIHDADTCRCEGTNFIH